MGILDPKTRLVDSIITFEGRKQLWSGNFKAQYYSFSDNSAVYSKTDAYVSGTGNKSEQLTTKYVFEADPQAQKDTITNEVNDAGKLVVSEFSSSNGRMRILNGIQFLNVTGSLTRVTASTLFTETTNDFLQQNLKNFKNLRIIGSPSLFDDNFDEFTLSTNEIVFPITEKAPIPNQTSGGVQVANIDHIESLFLDKRLSHLPNYKFLPPVNKARLGTLQTTPLGIYADIGQKELMTLNDVQKEVANSAATGYGKVIKFAETSSRNRLHCQFFEISADQMAKLDIIDFGVFQKNQQQHHVFFAGKLFTDSTGTDTFVNIFTVIFS